MIPTNKKQRIFQVKNFHEKLEEKVRMEHQLKEKVCILESQAGFGRPADVKVDLFTCCYLRLAWNPFFIVGVFFINICRERQETT